MLEQIISALLGGVVTGLITWGGVRVEMRWIRADLDRAHLRIDWLERRARARS